MNPVTPVGEETTARLPVRFYINTVRSAKADFSSLPPLDDVAAALILRSSGRILGCSQACIIHTSTAFIDLMCSFCQEVEAATCVSDSCVSGRLCRLDMSSPQRDTGPANSAEAKKADPRMSEKKCCELSATF